MCTFVLFYTKKSQLTRYSCRPAHNKGGSALQTLICMDNILEYNFGMDEQSYILLDEMRNILDSMIILLSNHFDDPKKTGDTENDYFADLHDRYQELVPTIPSKLKLTIITIPFQNLEQSHKQLHLNSRTPEGILKELRNLKGEIRATLRDNRIKERGPSSADLKKIFQYTSNLKRNSNPETIHKSGTQFSDWSEVHIRFVTKNNVIIMRGKDIIDEKEYGQLGFADKRNGRPVQSWFLLLEFAKRGGVLDPDDLGTEARISLAQRKRDLTKRLYAFFKIPGDPFYPYTDEEQYEMRIALEVSDELANKTTFETDKYYSELTPEKLDISEINWRSI